MRIYLTGFMGCGKTTVGRLLARRLGAPFVDLDDEVERRAGMTVREIFERQGEPAFRQMEAEALRGTLALPDVVVAMGGGTMAFEANAAADRARAACRSGSTPPSRRSRRASAGGARPTGRCSRTSPRPSRSTASGSRPIAGRI